MNALPIPADLRVTFLQDGAQPAERTAHQLMAFLDQAVKTLDIAIYDFDLSPSLAQIVGPAFQSAKLRGVQVRLVYEGDHQDPATGPPPPGSTGAFVTSLGLDARHISSFRALMHHKYVVRDAASPQAAVWTGSTNWTDDAWNREENAILEVPSQVLAQHYTRDFEDLWQKGKVANTVPSDGGHAALRYADQDLSAAVYFCPGEGRTLAHTAARLITCAKHRLRIATPVLTNGGILGALADAITHDSVDVVGVYDFTQMEQVMRQWNSDPRTAWKSATWQAIVAHGNFSGKHSTPYSPDGVHDFMHAKMLVADDTVLTGSYNLSNNGRENAENVLLLPDPDLAQLFTGFVEAVATRYRR